MDLEEKYDDYNDEDNSYTNKMCLEEEYDSYNDGED